MLKAIFIYILKPHLNGIFFIVSAVILGFICWQVWLYLKAKNKRIPLPITILSAFTIFAGAESFILCFVATRDEKNFMFVFLIKVTLFFTAIITICLGIFLLKLKRWARATILWLIVISGLADTFITLTGADYTNLALELGIYAIIFTAYYLVLDKKYFKIDGEDFALHPDAATKKKPESFFDWLRDTDSHR